MIVPMKSLTLLCLSRERESTLEKLRELGTIQLNFGAGASQSCQQAEENLSDAKHALQILQDITAGKKNTSVSKTAEQFDETVLANPLPAIDHHNPVASILSVEKERRALLAWANSLDAKIATYAPFGDFDPEDVRKLRNQGFNIALFKTSVDAELPADVFAKVLGKDSANSYGVVIAPPGETASIPKEFTEIALPERGIATWKDLALQARNRAGSLETILKKSAALNTPVSEKITELSDRVHFIKAADSMKSQGPVDWITGWIPFDGAEKLQAEAERAGWGVVLRDPTPEETPPVLLRPPKLFRPVLALFKGLGIAPAYNESDISVPFFCFFSIFFAMLVGDGGYGAITLALTLLARKKSRGAAGKSWFILLTCFSIATIAWGVLSNCWFGQAIPALDNPVARWLDNSPGGADESYHHIMLLCFTLGVVHLSIARLWNSVMLFPDTKFLAELGWTGVLAFMYCMTCSIVGIFETPKIMTPVMCVSVALIFLFTLKKSELKSNGITLGMLPLNIVSALGDIISYVRLFAVGLASVKVAQNFNSMATGLSMPLWLKFIPMLAILLVGHALNYAMAALSILVHAVRLNTLEFSNHKGIGWAGVAFRPFRKTTLQ